MTWLRGTTSLLDTAGREPATWWLVYTDLPKSWWSKWLRKGYQHVEAWSQVSGGWIRIEPNFEFMTPSIQLDPPWISVPEANHQRVTVLRRMGVLRAPFFVGPITCVELVKAFLGVRGFWIRTPWQLFKYLKGKRS